MNKICQKYRDVAALYPITVRWSEEDESFIGTIHTLTGDCCHGDEPRAVFAECEEIAVECVEAAFSIGKELPKAPAGVVGQAALPDPDPALIRELLGLSQVKFAQYLGISAKTLHKWEQKTSRPSGAARSLLKVASANPRLVIETLGQ